MNAMRGLVAVAIVGLLAVGVQAEAKKSDNAKKLIGKWVVTKADDGTVPPDAQIEFTKDGKLIVSAKMGDQEIKHEGKYKVEGNTFVITFKMGDEEHTDTITIKKISDTEMSTSNKEGKVVELKRQK
jgi:uncharacterized protein (TIGR03066 family)